MTTITELARLAEAASDDPHIVYFDDKDKCWHVGGDFNELTEADCEFMAACTKQTILGLVRELAELRAKIDKAV